MKRFICIFLSLAIVFGMSGCSKAPTENSEVNSDTLHSMSQAVSSMTESTVSDNQSRQPSSSAEEKVQSSTAAQSSEVSAPPNISKPEETTEVSLAQKTLGNMSVEQKVAQLFIVYPEALNLNSDDTRIAGSVTVMNASIAAAKERYPVGGIIMFAANVVSPAQLKGLVSGLEENNQIPLFVSVDEEGGSVCRLAANPAFSLVNHGSTLSLSTPDKVLSTYCYIGGYLKSYGFNLDFAPVADIYSNPLNTVIGSRAFGKDADTVKALLPHAVKGLERNGIISCIKHFPGHGDTEGDTHNNTVTLNKSWAQLNGSELIPFKSAIENGAEMIMASHITLSGNTSDSLPTSLSKKMLTDKLRNELGFKGIIITDSLSMGAITGHYSAADAAVKAFEAGADILLMPSDFVAAYKAVLGAVTSGSIDEKRLNESVLRILDLKEKYGILKE